ncbi:unnamed protein product [Symbiodinium sp. KB8]|nr:unnamed protein product [Symbiodinium sp. KB8]
MPPVTSPRRANTASVQDIVPILKASLPADLDAEFKYPQSIEKFIEDFESLLRQLIAVTPRVTQTLVEQGLLSSFQNLDGTFATALAKQISGASAHVFQKLKQTTSGEKLSDPLVRLIQIARQHFDRDRSKSARNVKIQKKDGFLKKQEQGDAHDDPVDEIARLGALYKLPAGKGSTSSRSLEISSHDEEVEMIQPVAASTPVKVKPAAKSPSKRQRPLRACSSGSLQGTQHATSVPAAVRKTTVNYVFMNAESGHIVRNVSGAEQVADEVRSGKKGFMQARLGPDDWLDTSVANITYNMRQKTLKADTKEPTAPLQRCRGKKAADKAAAKASAPKGKSKAKAKAGKKAKAKAKSPAGPAGSVPAADPSGDAGVEAADSDEEVLDTSIPPCYRFMNYGGSRGIGLLKFVFMIGAGGKRRRRRIQIGSFRSKEATNEQLVEAADMTLHALDTGGVTEDGERAYAEEVYVDGRGELCRRSLLSSLPSSPDRAPTQVDRSMLLDFLVVWRCGILDAATFESWRCTGWMTCKARALEVMGGTKREADPMTAVKSKAKAKISSVYHDSDASAKHELINNYIREGGIKTLSWVPSYTEHAITSTENKQKVEDGYFTMGKIFEREGIQPEKKRQDIVLEAMRIENYKEHNIEYQDIKKDLIQEVAGCPELTKYFYVVAKSQANTLHRKESDMEITTNIKVKIENPEKVKANQHVTVLTNGKTAIQKVLDTIKDGISTLQHGKKPEYKDFVTEGLSIVEEADKFVEAARENISNHSIMQNDDSKTEKDWQEFGDKVQPLIDVCSTHVEGLKHYKLRMQDRRLSENLADLFLSGEISGKRARSLYEDAGDAEAVNVSDVASGSTDHNAHRDVLRRLLSNTQWPDLFECDIPVYNPKTNKESSAQLSMMLPHEVVHTMCRWNLDSIDKLASMEHLRPELAQKMEEIRSFLGGSSASSIPLVGMGLWADGVPIKGDRSESLEMITLSFPGLGDRQTIRIPLTAMNKKFFLKDGQTWDALFKEISWSCHSLLSGVFPSHRWDGTPLQGKRARWAGCPLHAGGAPLEIRGDWAMLKASFRMPSWSSKRNCCFVCKATPETMRDLGPAAPWRTKLWNNAELLTEMLELHNTYSPIFEAPFVDIHTFCIDWLHCCDLGVCQDYLGNAMWLIATKLPGDTMDQRTRALFDDIRQYYAAFRCENQLSTLTPLMLRKAASNAPKLRSKAGEARSLVDWVVAACDKYLQGSCGLSSEEYACRLASKHLQACYRNLHAESFDADDLAFHCKQFLHLCHGGILC